MSAMLSSSSSGAAVALKPQRLSRNEAQARSALAQRAAGLPFSLGGAWRATLRPAPRPDALPGLHCWTARVEWAGAVFVLQLPAEAIAQCLEAVLAAELGDAVRIDTLPPELATAAVSAALRQVLDGLQSLGRGAPQLVALQTEPVEVTPQDTVAFAHVCELLLKADAGPQAIAGVLWTDTLGLLLLAGLVAKRAPQPGPLDDALPIALRAEIGHSRLTARELGGLEAGDVLLLDAAWTGPRRVLWLSADGRAGLHVQLPAMHDATAEDAAAVPPSLTVLSPWTATMPVSNTAADLAADAAAAPATLVAASLDDVPLRVSFDLGELTLSLAQLRAMQPGQVLELGHPLAGAVRIRANGALVGDGELVEVDGQLGVAVRTLFAPVNAQG
ncbi:MULTISPECIES: type III secretion system cytoplasmic ring protein SctQ [unclassified Variovorax]|uniref:type III secretion system cytoplasmic ring protein SctQ n=1 Tax=unclassified Variovorax TaxID=663243 RepID=UPI0008C17389|nr:MULTISPECIES: type III secretion system cytoplasmic ring protein SctQ [unclassified Variovorax]SEK10077.1 type III secretion system apparatus protein YscQ/HrcQ [Variovorax sp. OK202]SFD66223.1 type III secretion system apparatus protein YscQ/HrcQ [Variovorax sp. OK212]